MIRFKRKDTKVIIDVEHGVFNGGEYFELEINQSQEYQAELLRKAFQENLNKHLKQTKEKYYNMGWKHAKAKSKKWTSFWGGFEK